MSFHLSLPVRDVEVAVNFFTGLLGGKVAHRDPTGYVNVDWFGTQLTLSQGEPPHLHDDLHFGVNVDMATFEALATRIKARAAYYIVAPVKIVDANTPLERRKLVVRCPDGYLVELKGVSA